MKLIFFLSIFIFSNALIAQTDSSNTNRQDIYVYNNLKDTIHLSKINCEQICFCGDPKIIDTIQIDRVGSKEIVFLRNCIGHTEEHGGSFDISRSVTLSKYEIWNLDTKQMIFVAINFHDYEFQEYQAYGNPEHINGTILYSYDFKIDSVGQITISNLKTTTNTYKAEWKTVIKNGKSEPVVENVPYEINNLFLFMPDKTEGTYRYVKGKYIHE